MKLFFVEFKFRDESVPNGRMITCESEERARQMILDREKYIDLNGLNIMEIKVIEDAFGDVVYSQ